MPVRNGLTEIDQALLFTIDKSESTFGQVGDYATVYVYNYQDIDLEFPLGTFDVPAKNFYIHNDNIDIDIGQHLRDNAFSNGTYRVIYYFYRPIAGSNKIIYLDKGKPTTREIQSINKAGRQEYYYDTANGNQVPVSATFDKYFISKISRTKTEVEIFPQQIDDNNYISKLYGIGAPIKYHPIETTNTGMEILDPASENSNIVELHRHTNDEGFTSQMVGGTISIPEVYVVEEPKMPNPEDVSDNFDPDKEFDTQNNDPTEEGQPESPYLHSDGQTYVWTMISDNSQDGYGGESPPIQTLFKWVVQPLTVGQNTVVKHKPFVSKIIKFINSERVQVADSFTTQATKQFGIVTNDWKREARKNGGFVEYSTNDIDNLNTYLIVDEEAYLVTNTFEDSTKVGVKLYSQLSDRIQPNSLVHFVSEILKPIEEEIRVIPFDEDVELNNSVFLSVPNIDGKDNPVEFRGTTFKSYNDLVGSNSTVIQEIEDKLVSGSLLNTKINVDYQKRLTSIDEYNDNGFGNFINFGSAEARLKNFKYKFELIEKYQISSSKFAPISSSTDSTTYYDNKVNEVKNSFDPYETFLYNESSSYVSSSAGEFHDTCWPKENSSSPYTLVPTTGSVAVTWYDNMIESASLYDTMNDNRLVNNLPGHVKFDEESKNFTEFVDMIGQQFDESWIYVKHFTDMNDRRNKFSEGISKDIVKQVAKASGLEVVNGNDLLNLSEYLLGKDIDDGSQTYEKAQEEVTEEIWKRILANLPFFQRTKGTTRALRGLLNCYGIPSSILRVREYGGPDYNGRISTELDRNFTYALDFRSNQYIQHLWTPDTTSGQVPETVEFRFRTPKRQNQTIIQKGNDWAISLLDGGVTNKGKLKFQITGSNGNFFITSSTQQFYNDEMWSVMLTRRSQSGAELTTDNITQDITYELTTKQYDATRFKINYQTSSSFSTGSIDLNAAFTGSNELYIGGSGSKFDGNNFSGSMMEYRLWTEPLTSSSFDNHVRTPKAYNGNTTSSHADNLVFRLTLDEDIDLTSEYVSSSVDNTSYSARSGSQTTFTSNQYRSINEVEEMRIPNIGASRRNSNKIRIEDGFLTGSLAREVSLQKSSFDFAPVDSNKLGVYFSPTDVIDKDIIYSLADVNYDNYIGDPRDQYESTYRELDNARKQYWKKYPEKNNFFDYLRILQYYDSGIFKQMESLLPARAKTTLGVLVEPNILNRSKEVIGDTPEYESLYYENAGEFERGIAPYHTSSVEKTVVTVGSEYTYYESETSVNRWIPESGSVGKVAMPSIYSIDKRLTNEWGNSFSTASITSGDIALTFQEALQPIITASRMSEHNKVYEYYFSSSADAKAHPSNGTDAFHIGAMSGSHYSWSLQDSEYQTLAYDSTLFRSFFAGTKIGDDIDDPNYPAVSVTLTSPTRLVTVDPGESRLVEDSKLRPRDTGFIKGEERE